MKREINKYKVIYNKGYHYETLKNEDELLRKEEKKIFLHMYVCTRCDRHLPSVSSHQFHTLERRTTQYTMRKS